MCVVDFKQMYNTLESQTTFLRGLRPKTHFPWVRHARLASTDPKIIFLYYHLG